MKQAIIKFGEAEYKIGLLKVKQLRELDEMHSAMPDKTSGSEMEIFFFDQMVKIIIWGINASGSKMSAEEFDKIPTTMEELFAARREILLVAGLLVKEDKKVGEVNAGAS